MNRCTYLLPIRRAAFDASEAESLRSYFEQLKAAACEILVIDGSPDDVFIQHHDLWSGACRHEHVDRSFGYLNDKVNGVHTGVSLAVHENIVLADDDMRYSAENVQEVCDRLDRYEVVRPQNYLRPLPWWARMEAARMLINRATLRAADYPGTCAFRKSAMLRVGHYDGDVLFDNEEIIRHFARHDASICYANDLFVEKRPPTFRKWIEQRPRQAYEDFPLRAKTVIFFAIPILLVIALAFGKIVPAVATLIVASIALAAIGRARGEAAHVFPANLALFAPPWVLERSLSTYWALWWFITRGGYPFGGRLLTKGVGRDWFAGARAVRSSTK